MSDMSAVVRVELQDKFSAAARRLVSEARKVKQAFMGMNRTGSGGSTSRTNALRREEVIARKLRMEVGKLGTAYEKLKRNGKSLFARGGAMAGAYAALKGGVAAMGLPAFGTAVDFEKLQLMLKNATTSAGEAKAAMAWIMETEAKTPFNLEEVTRAFISLRQMGIDPMKGAFMAAGDAAAANGIDILSTVEALKDAATGENERLKQLGVRASTKGSKVTYSYADKAGKMKQVTVDLKNQIALIETLSAILNEKFGGSQADLAKGWSGILSSIDSMRTKIELAVMKGGAFDRMKGFVDGFLQQLQRWEADGTLQRVADRIGNNLVSVLDGAAQAAKGLWTFGEKAFQVLDKMATIAGGYENLGYMAAALWVSGKALGVIVAGAQAVSILSGIVALGGAGSAAGLLAVAGAIAAIGAAVGGLAVADQAIMSYEQSWAKKLEGLRPQLRDDRANPAINYADIDPRNQGQAVGRALDVIFSERFQQIKTAMQAKFAEILAMARAYGPQLVSAVVSGLGSLWDVGAQWMGSLLSGIQAKAGEILSYVSGIGSSIASALTGGSSIEQRTPQPGTYRRGQAAPAARAAPKFGGPRAHGGSVHKGMLHPVNERGVELLAPSRHGIVSPLSKLGGLGGKSVNVNMGGITINGQASRSVMTELADHVERAVQRALHDGAYAT